MKAPLNWLRSYVDINVDSKEFADAMTMSGSKVEGMEVLGKEISNVVVGKLLTLEKHPGADRLQVSDVDAGSGVVRIVTGAQNISVGDYVPIALHGSTLPGGVKITRGKLRGVESNGMMCSIQELGLTKHDFPWAAEDGIFILDGEYKPGTDIKEVLGLNDTVAEFEITSNRPDCLSMVGLAREAAVTFKSAFRNVVPVVKEEGEEASGYASVEILDADLCPRYAARIVTDVKVAPSPGWMKERLRAAGVRPINNIVDITNYVMLELGQPMHAFDLEYLHGRKITVRRAKDGEEMTTLDEQQRKLESSMLVIADADRAVAVAGVMGGANSEIKEDTAAILFESANFNGVSVRMTSKKLGLRTEASGRFEKGLDAETAITAVNRAAQLVEELGAGKVCKGIIDCHAKKAQPCSISFRPDRINALLGADISQNTMVDIFKALELVVDEANMTIGIPSFRSDLEGEADLAEEVARFYGYNMIEPSLLAGMAATLGRKSFKQKIEDLVKNTAMACGYLECYTYSFVSPKVFDLLNLPAESTLRNAVTITNPLGEDFSIMRTTTIPEMLEVISTNYNRRIDEGKLFELSYVYLPKALPVSELPEEKMVLTLGTYGSGDFYELKGVIEEILSKLGISDYSFEPVKDNPSFHPGRTAEIFICGKSAGLVGEIHPLVANSFEAPERTYIAVVEAQALVDNASVKARYMPLPKFPAVTRDIAMLVRDDIMVRDIERIIRQKAGKVLENLKLFDVYKGKQVPDGMKSVAYSIIFRADDRTLKDEEINGVMGEIVAALKDNIDAQLR